MRRVLCPDSYQSRLLRGRVRRSRIPSVLLALRHLHQDPPRPTLPRGTTRLPTVRSALTATPNAPDFLRRGFGVACRSSYRGSQPSPSEKSVADPVDHRYGSNQVKTVTSLEARSCTDNNPAAAAFATPRSRTSPGRTRSIARTPAGNIATARESNFCSGSRHAKFRGTYAGSRVAADRGGRAEAVFQTCRRFLKSLRSPIARVRTLRSVAVKGI